MEAKNANLKWPFKYIYTRRTVIEIVDTNLLDLI